MNAIEFVKMFGFVEAKKTLDDCIFLEAAFFNCLGFDICVSDLKQIVEAFELVEKHGGVFSANCKIENECPDPEFGDVEYYVDGDIFFTPSFELVKAIKLVEQCQ